MTYSDVMSCSFEALAGELVRAAHEAGRAILPHYGSDISVDFKADDSPVTAADVAAEAVIVAALQRVCPDVPIVAEESASAGNIPKILSAFFLVDPLDGTREFINKRDEFTVNIGLIVERRPVMGVVYAPALGVIYATLEEGKAFRASVDANETLDNPSALSFEEIRVRTAEMNGLTVVASRSHLDRDTETFLSGFKIKDKISAGSSIKFCRVAAGEADLYPRFGRTMEWDTAAGDCILTAAGGRVTGVNGEPFLYGKSEEKFANPGFLCWGGR